MNRLTTIDVSKLTPHSVGFDRLLDTMFRHADHQTQNAGFPPYNIRKHENTFQIEMALAGVAQEDLEIETSNGVLTISHDPTEVEEQGELIHRGVAVRKFKRSFTLADDVVVNGARMKNGMLYIQLERIVPEEKQPKKIAITFQE